MTRLLLFFFIFVLKSSGTFEAFNGPLAIHNEICIAPRDYTQLYIERDEKQLLEKYPITFFHLRWILCLFNHRSIFAQLDFCKKLLYLKLVCVRCLQSKLLAFLIYRFIFVCVFECLFASLRAVVYVSMFLFHLWSPYVIGRPYIFSCCGLFFFFFFSSPNLSRRLDVCHILPHMVWP